MPRKYNWKCGQCGKGFKHYYRSWNGVDHRDTSLLAHKDKTNHDIRDDDYKAMQDAEAEAMQDAFDDGYIGDGDYAY